MPKIARTVLAAIDANVQAFRARGRPLTPDAVDDLARAWLAHWATFRITRDVTAEFWAVWELRDLQLRDPGSAVAVLGRALELDASEDVEFFTFEELQPLVREHLDFLRVCLPGFLDSHPSLQGRLHRLCAGVGRPYGWSQEAFAGLCSCLTK